MALLESINLPQGTKLPEFTLNDSYGKAHKSIDLMGDKGLLVIVTCNHCPYAIAIWERVVNLSTYAKNLSINTIAINPNIHPNYPEDAPEKMQEKIKEWKIDFPYLVDETQEVSKQLDAQCTPDIYLYNANQELYYHGRLDDNWRDSSKVQKEELKEAIELLSKNSEAPTNQYPSMGCSIKWKS